MKAHVRSIGLVLSSVPAYSETFFVNKINGLTERGYKIILFARGTNSAHLKCQIVQPFPVLHNKVLQFILECFVLAITFLRAPRATIRFWQLESKEGEYVIKILKLIYFSSHILPYKLDWISFGFATQALGKEVLARAMGAKMSISLRGFDITVYPLLHSGCYNKLWKYVNKVHTLSDDLMIKAFRNGMPLALEVVKIPPAISEDFFHPNNQPLHINDNNKVIILTVARLHWIKGLEYALEAWASLKMRGGKFVYKIIGEGKEFEKLVFLRDQMDLNEEVEFLGKKNTYEIKQIMQTAHIYLQPSIHEGFCNAVLEAQAMKCLCIVTDAGGLSENILHNKTGWVVSKCDSQAIVNKIVQVLNMPKDYVEQVRTAARLRIESEFLLEKHLKSWISFYES
ncbi:MAG: glycosyltransferase family 4 protein [Flavobacteriales bacterium]|nr:glycosyltransferase family 4 protein [Flavobacteriales bacterium]